MKSGSRQLSFISVSSLLWIGAAAAAHASPDRTWLGDARKAAVPEVRPVRSLPDAHGRRFTSLDAYLEHLRAYAAPVGRPWYRRVKPDLYRLERGNYRPLGGPPADRLFTRAELQKKFGFRQ